jgi:nicotinamide-nucleotide adenylyltransferase
VAYTFYDTGLVVTWGSEVPERGLFVGRFQPPHKGHMEAIKWIFKNGGVDELIVAIGSAQESHTLRNPFTAGERMEMLRMALAEYNVSLSSVLIVPVPDIAMNFVWVRYLEMLLPRFYVVFSRNPLVVRLFREYGYKVVSPPSFERERYSATVIRKLMLDGNEAWRELVPYSVAKYIDDIGGLDRIRSIAGRD